MNYWVVGSEAAHRALFDTCLSRYSGTWRYVDAPGSLSSNLIYQENPVYVFILGTKFGISQRIRQHFKCILFHDSAAPLGTKGYWKVFASREGAYAGWVAGHIYNLVYHIPQEAKMAIPDGKVSVVIPVGPNEAYLKWLPECLDSVIKQTYPVDEIVLVDDSQGILGERYLDMLGFPALFDRPRGDFGELRLDVIGKPKVVVWRSPWTMGVPAAFNVGVGLASNELVFMLGSDDKLMPTCIEECVKTYNKNKTDAWYSVTYITQGGEQSYIPNNAAMVTKRLWRWLGGFPPSAGVGGCDALLLSILMKHAPHRIIYVKQGTSLCWLREHEHQDTRRNAWTFSGEIVSIRNKETDRFVPKGLLS